MHFMPKQQALACAVLCVAAITAARANSLPPAAAAQMAQMTPGQRAAFVRSFAPSRAHVAAAVGAGRLDTTPPTLANFNVTPPADAAGPLAQVIVHAKASDDLSGVQTVMFELVGPHGQAVWFDDMLEVPTKNFSGKIAVDVSAYLEPGTWTVQQAYVIDAAGNYAIYSGPALAALGNSQVTIVSSHGDLADYTPPTLTQGTVSTPTLSVSGLQKGTSQPPIAAVDFTASDVGSGIRHVESMWCLADSSACLFTTLAESVRGRQKDTLSLGTSIAGAPPGTYLLEYVGVYDYAGNWTSYMGTDFGGDTDFSTLMPAGHSITVTP
jgi:hypothetical protein